MVGKKWMEPFLIGKKMKYFTKDWCFSRLDDQEIEQKLQDYRNYINAIYMKLPFALKLLVWSINLHDGRLELLSFNLHKKKLILRGVFGDLEFGYFILEIKYLNVYNLDVSIFNSIFKNQQIEILSDEIEVLKESLFSHRLLLSTHEDIDIQFEDIEIKIQNTISKNYKKLSCQFKVINST